MYISSSRFCDTGNLCFSLYDEKTGTEKLSNLPTTSVWATSKLGSLTSKSLPETTIVNA